MTTDFDEIATLKQFVQVGLLGKVTANLAAVFAQRYGKRITLLNYFFQEPTEADHEYIELAATEIIANFPTGYTVDTRYDLLSEMELESTLNCVFLRAEAEAQILGRRALQSRESEKGREHR